MARIGKYEVHSHLISVHFTNALYPVALFFLVLSYFYQKDYSRFTYINHMILATFSAPISYATGIIEWKQKYRGARVKTFSRKYRIGILLIVQGISCLSFYAAYPEVLEDRGWPRTLFFLLNFSILPTVVYLGHLGGKIIFGKVPHCKPVSN